LLQGRLHSTPSERNFPGTMEGYGGLLAPDDGGLRRVTGSGRRVTEGYWLRTEGYGGLLAPDGGPLLGRGLKGIPGSASGQVTTSRPRARPATQLPHAPPIQPAHPPARPHLGCFPRPPTRPPARVVKKRPCSAAPCRDVLSSTWPHLIEPDLRAASRHAQGDPVIVLVHGYGASSYHWRYNVPALAEAGYLVGGALPAASRGAGEAGFAVRFYILGGTDVDVPCALRGWGWINDFAARRRQCAPVAR
jgi:hypothetical protein